MGTSPESGDSKAATRGEQAVSSAYTSVADSSFNCSEELLSLVRNIRSVSARDGALELIIKGTFAPSFIEQNGDLLVTVIKEEVMEMIQSHLKSGPTEDRALLALAVLAATPEAKEETHRFLVEEYLGETSSLEEGASTEPRHSRKPSGGLILALAKLGEVAEPTLIKILSETDSRFDLYELKPAYRQICLMRPDFTDSFMANCISTLERLADPLMKVYSPLDELKEIRDAKTLEEFLHRRVSACGEGVVNADDNEQWLLALCEYSDLKGLATIGPEVARAIESVEHFYRQQLEPDAAAKALDRFVDVVEAADAALAKVRDSSRAYGLSGWTNMLFEFIGDIGIQTEKQQKFIRGTYFGYQTASLGAAIVRFGNEELIKEVVDQLVATLESGMSSAREIANLKLAKQEAARIVLAMADSPHAHAAVEPLKELADIFPDASGKIFREAHRVLASRFTLDAARQLDPSHS